jgi:sulfur carrier protein
VNVTVNGRDREVPEGTTVAGVVAELAGPPAAGRTGPAGVAVAVNDAVVPRGDWESVLLRSADRVEVLTAVQGG